MAHFWYVFIAILAVVSVISIIFCIVRGKGASHKRLVIFSSILGVVAMICFGGEVVLNHFDMGWRCTPFNIMLMLCVVLSIITLCCCIGELFIRFENSNKVLIGCAYISMVVVVFIILISALSYFQLSSWCDGLSTYNNQTIVYANDQHGGSCSWHYYAHINSLIHGIEITQDGWWGYPPFKSS